MLIQANIFTTVLNAKYYSGLLLTKITEQEIGGEDCTKLKQQFTILGKWIVILEDYLDNNFDSDGNLVPPTFACLSADEAAELTAKLNLMIGCITAPQGSDWILATAYWDDGGFWRDTATWNDTLPIT